jgi:solute carrier family 25 phosphate transporter 3
MPEDKKDMSYFLKCMTAGAMACGLTHFLVTPLDVVKCKIQA